MSKRTVMSPKEVKRALVICMKAGLVPFIKGSPGVGKSSIVQQVCDQYGLKVIDDRMIQLEPPDLKGYGQVVDGRVRNIPLEEFPLEGDPIPDGYNGWVYFLDEYNGGGRAVQAASYKLILDRKVGQRKLHDKCFIVCAGNLASDNAYTVELNTAAQSRLVHMQLEVSLQDWLEWALPAGVDRRITTYLSWQPANLNTFQPDHEGDTFACQRTWEMLHKAIKDMPTQEVMKESKLMAGIVSEGVASHFTAFLGSYAKLPNLADILRDPENTKMPAERQIQFALADTVSGWITEDNAPQLMLFVNRMPKEMQIITLRHVVARNPDAFMWQEIMDWTTVNGATFWGNLPQTTAA